MPATVNILSVPVHNVTQAETLSLIADFVTSRQPHQLCTANPEFVMAARADSEFMTILRDADLCLPDGVGLLWASKVLGEPLRERVAGSDLVPAIATEAAKHGWRLFLLGAAEGVADQTASILKSRHPNLIVAGTWAGSPDSKEEEAITARIRAARPDVLLVAYGAPAQDKWIARNRDRLRVPVMMGVGGAFDFVAGVAERAPRWMQKLGLEWLHRLIRQPWRWKRMLALPQFAIAVLLYNRQ
ncbi:MAG: WecB/TagA/CpsF family glycosyltransferase [Chloroflexi bacterium]|nr:WecB/TagA/CpsF family glycosyltransferase [Chloroflexota bacterium]